MADLKATINTAKIAIVASATATLLQLVAPANQRVKISRIGVFFDEEVGDLTPANPLLIAVGRVTGTSGGTIIAAQKIEPGSEAVQTTALHTLAGGTLETLDSASINPQAGYDVMYPMGQEIILAGGESFGVQVTSGAVISTDGLNAIAKIWFEE